MSATRYSYENVTTSFLYKAANYTAGRYRHYGVTVDDCAQEVYLWLAGDGEARVLRWLASSPQQTTRIYMTFLDRMKRYAEKEKAHRAGYHPDDVKWYTTGLIETILPLALEDADEDLQIDGDFLVMVIDVRKAIEALHLVEYFRHNDNRAPGWDENTQRVVDYLGGNRSYIGRRSVISNSTAMAITADQW